LCHLRVMPAENRNEAIASIPSCSLSNASKHKSSTKKECLLGVIRFTLTVRRSLPVFPNKRTIQELKGATTRHAALVRVTTADAGSDNV
jgi:hypothetical protein